MITIKQKGDFKKLDNYFLKSKKIVKFDDAESFAITCIERLKAVTPADSGLTADSWDYTITKEKNSVHIEFFNRNIQNGVNVALLLEYGHGTKNGGWVEGKNYIAPTVLKTYLDIVDNTWKEIKNL